MRLRRKTPSWWLAVRRAAAAAVLPALLATTAPAGAAPLITATEPAQLPLGPASGRQTIVLHGRGLVAPGTTFRTVADDVQVWFDGGGGWKRAKLVVPGLGWGPAELTVELPALSVPPEGLGIKVAVAGVESAAHPIPAFTPLPPAFPRIVSLAPAVTPVGGSFYQFTLEVVGDGHGGRLLFDGAVPDGLTMTREAQARDVYRFPVPERLRGRPGRYLVQLENAVGRSNLISWELVAKPEVAAIAPASIVVGGDAAGPPQPVSVMATFKDSGPRTVSCRADDAPAWEPVPSVLFLAEQVSFELDVERLRPVRRVEIKFANAAGETTFSIPVVDSSPRADVRPPPKPR